MTNEELLEKARNDYPIGTKFKSWDDNNQIREIKPYKGEDIVTWYIDSIDCVRSDNGIYCGDGGCSNPSIYKEGVWAEIISRTRHKENLLITIL